MVLYLTTFYIRIVPVKGDCYGGHCGRDKNNATGGVCQRLGRIAQSDYRGSADSEPNRSDPVPDKPRKVLLGCYVGVRSRCGDGQNRWLSCPQIGYGDLAWQSTGSDSGQGASRVNPVGAEYCSAVGLDTDGDHLCPRSQCFPDA